MEYVIGVDIGSSNIKAIAFDDSAMPLAESSISCSFLPNPDNRLYQEQDPDIIFTTVLQCIANLQKSMRGGNPAAIGLSSAMHSLIALDRNDKPLTRCMSWADLRSRNLANELKNTKLGRDLYRHTGTPVHPMSPLTKIAWLRRHNPDLFNQSAMFLGIKEFIVLKLFGHKLCDYSIASATGLFDIFNYRWYSPALDYAGIDTTQLPEPVDSLHMLTGLNAYDAGRLSLPPETPWVIGASDGCLANLGALVFDENDAIITLGTSAALRRKASQPTDDALGRVFNYLLYRDCYITGGASNNGGYLAQWFATSLCKESGFEQLLAEVEKTAPGAEGLLFLPFVLGERAPLWDPDATGAFVGIRSHHDRAHFQRAVLEGMLFNLYEIAQVLISLAGPIPRLHVNGGLAR
ncbi:MAG TPA: gluconokinase, partial [Gammaproteobacteria bacterium]